MPLNSATENITPNGWCNKEERSGSAQFSLFVGITWFEILVIAGPIDNGQSGQTGTQGFVMLFPQTNCCHCSHVEERILQKSLVEGGWSMVGHTRAMLSRGV